jgi:hypothetical protein
VNYNPRTPAIEIGAENMGDPESGLSDPTTQRKNRVQWRVRELADSKEGLYYEGVFYEPNLGTNLFNQAVTVTEGLSYVANKIAAYGFQVILTLENGAGMTRIVKEKHVVKPIESWDTPVQQLWGQALTMLRQDQRNASDIVAVVRMLDQFSPSKRERLLQRLNQAQTSQARTNVIQAIKQGPAP